MDMLLATLSTAIYTFFTDTCLLDKGQCKDATEVVLEVTGS